MIKRRRYDIHQDSGVVKYKGGRDKPLTRCCDPVAIFITHQDFIQGAAERADGFGMGSTLRLRLRERSAGRLLPMYFQYRRGKATPVMKVELDSRNAKWYYFVLDITTEKPHRHWFCNLINPENLEPYQQHLQILLTRRENVYFTLAHGMTIELSKRNMSMLVELVKYSEVNRRQQKSANPLAARVTSVSSIFPTDTFE
ncbi:unnamed protein product [Acanthoscelides obtectus]|uniref:Uncharacterized protein n=1 Tax=Acanthoscelides obtectus TaxID=200917 RepID=A0A9P0QAS1_ACAOB|nr:unnamed protein product [Acanthoscelides obtectus]CAK1630463.1 hypothetical protein AOBTE_LOCUS6343 [Acanthoscelides obtectus]